MSPSRARASSLVVIGVPNEEFREDVKAAVDPRDGLEPEARLFAYCLAQLSRVEWPRSVDFDNDLSRPENGQLYERVLTGRC